MGYSSMETEGAHSHNLPPLLRLLGLLLLQPPQPYIPTPAMGGMRAAFTTAPASHPPHTRHVPARALPLYPYQQGHGWHGHGLHLCISKPHPPLYQQGHRWHGHGLHLCVHFPYCCVQAPQQLLHV